MLHKFLQRVHVGEFFTVAVIIAFMHICSPKVTTLFLTVVTVDYVSSWCVFKWPERKLSSAMVSVSGLDMDSVMVCVQLAISENRIGNNTLGQFKGCQSFERDL